MLKGGGVQFESLKNPGIDLYSGFRKTSQGGGVKFEILKKCVRPPPPPPPNLKTWIRHWKSSDSDDYNIGVNNIYIYDLSIFAQQFRLFTKQHLLPGNITMTKTK